MADVKLPSIRTGTLTLEESQPGSWAGHFKARRATLLDASSEQAPRQRSRGQPRRDVDSVVIAEEECACRDQHGYRPHCPKQETCASQSPLADDRGRIHDCQTTTQMICANRNR